MKKNNKINNNKKKPIDKKFKKKFNFGFAHIFSSFNNTIVTITNNSGNTVSWATSSSIGFKGAKKCSPHAAQIASEVAAKKALKRGIRNFEVFIKGPGPGRESAIRGLSNAGSNIISITDITPIPHNGCKSRKIRRN